MGAGFTVTTGPVALSASATKSLWLLNPATNRAVLTQMDVSMDASTVVGGIQFDLYRVTTIGTPAGTAKTPALLDPASQAATVTALSALTTEPTAVAVLASWYVQPVGGLYTVQFPLGREVVLAAAGARVGLRAVNGTTATPDVIANVWFEE